LDVGDSSSSAATGDPGGESYPEPVTEANPQKTDQFVAALVAAFPNYVVGRLAALGVEPDDELDAAVASANSRLEIELRELLSQPELAQVESPLEVVRRATQPITAMLAGRGVPPAGRDEWHAETQPEDPYGLYPASSQELGEEAWRLHLDWGVRKARAVAGVVPKKSAGSGLGVPAVALFGVPVEQRDGLREVIERRDYRALIWRNPAALDSVNEVRPVLVLVYLGHPEAHQAIRRLAREQIRVVALGEDVNDLTMPGVMALGAEEVIDPGRLLSRLDRLLPDRA
jgi:hypothetical protein